MAPRKAAQAQVVEGTVTADPELRLGQSLYAMFPIAVDVASGEDQRRGTPVAYVVCFGTLANDVACLVSEGTRVAVTGQTEIRTRATAAGEAGTVRRIVADAVGRANTRTSDEGKRRVHAKTGRGAGS